MMISLSLYILHAIIVYAIMQDRQCAIDFLDHLNIVTYLIGLDNVVFTNVYSAL